MWRVFSFLDVVAPPTCFGCGAVVQSLVFGALCKDCVPQLTTDLVRVPHADIIEHCWSMGDYEGLLGRLVRRAKYERSLLTADFLGELLGERLVGLVEVDAVIPVPTAWTRRIWRGYDQSERMAQGIADKLHIKCLPVLVRHGVQQQVGKSAEQRRRLSHRTFSSREQELPKRVLLVDDVITTGTTMMTAARTLRRGGVNLVFGVSIAHRYL